MNLKEYAADKGITLAEAKEKTGLTHWAQKVVQSVSQTNDRNGVTDTSYHSTPPVKAPAITEPEEKTEPNMTGTEAHIRLSLRVMVNKSPYWADRKKYGYE